MSHILQPAMFPFFFADGNLQSENHTGWLMHLNALGILKGAQLRSDEEADGWLSIWQGEIGMGDRFSDAIGD